MSYASTGTAALSMKYLLYASPWSWAAAETTMFPSECAIMYLRPGSAFTAEARPDADAKAFSTFPW